MRPRGVPKGVKVLSQCRDQIGGVEVTFTIGRIEPDDREQKVRELANLGRAMTRFVGRPDSSFQSASPPSTPVEPNSGGRSDG